MKVEKAYDHARGVLKYLSWYLKGWPVKSQQVKESVDEVKLRHKDHCTGLIRYQKFSKAGFIKQLLLHTPPFGMPMIRHYGLYATSCNEERVVAAEIVGYGGSAVVHKAQVTSDSDIKLSEIGSFVAVIVPKL